MTLYAVGATVVSVLFAGNIFFLKKLVQKIDKVDTIEALLKQNNEKFATQINNIVDQMKDLKTRVDSRIDNIGDLKSEVAVLKYVLANKDWGKING